MMNRMIAITTALFMLTISACATPGENLESNTTDSMSTDESLEQATFGGGCFWCVEAVFERLKGVKAVQSGYAGGDEKNPSYREVSSGNTGHAEVTQVTFNPNIISYTQLLEVFFKTHDPTTLNRQGADVGPQYRSIILYHNEAQKERARHVKNKLDESDIFDDPIVTEIEELDAFYTAEDYHQNYYDNNPNQGYCRIVIAPKLEKMEKLFEDLLKESETM